MAIRKEFIGTGITARERTFYSGSDIKSYLRALANQREEALEAGGGEFGAMVLGLERSCKRILTGRSNLVRFEPDSDEDYARRILRLIELTRSCIERGDPDSAARFGLQVGCLYMEAHIKAEWEADALRGRKNATTLRAGSESLNRKLQAAARRRYAAWQAKADELRANNKKLSNSDLARLIAKELGGNPGTIRRKIR